MSSSDEVSKLAALSRLAIPAGEEEAFAKEFESILAYVGKLESLSLDMTETPQVGVVHNVFREDTTAHEGGAFTEKIVEAFPDKEGNVLKVKQILSHD